MPITPKVSTQVGGGKNFPPCLHPTKSMTGLEKCQTANKQEPVKSLGILSRCSEVILYSRYLKADRQANSQFFKSIGCGHITLKGGIRASSGHPEKKFCCTLELLSCRQWNKLNWITHTLAFTEPKENEMCSFVCVDNSKCIKVVLFLSE